MTDVEFYTDVVQVWKDTMEILEQLHPGYVRTRLAMIKAANEWSLISDSLYPKDYHT